MNKNIMMVVTKKNKKEEITTTWDSRGGHKICSNLYASGIFLSNSDFETRFVISLTSQIAVYRAHFNCQLFSIVFSFKLPRESLIAQWFTWHIFLWNDQYKIFQNIIKGSFFNAKQNFIDQEIFSIVYNKMRRFFMRFWS